MEISVNNKSYFINRISCETNGILSRRLWFIIKQNPMTETEYEYALQLSEIWYYMTYHGCKYSAKLERRVKAVL